MPPRMGGGGGGGVGVELEIVEGITEHSSRVALKGVFQNFGDVVACWVPPIDRRGLDRASVRFGNAQSAEAAKSACDQGQVYLQGLAVKCDYRTGGGRRVGNSDLGESSNKDDEQRQARAIMDAPPSRRRSRSRGRRRSRSRDRDRKKRSRSRRRDRSRSKDRGGGGMDQAAPPALPAPTPSMPPPMPAMGMPPAGMPGMPPGGASPGAFTGVGPVQNPMLSAFVPPEVDMAALAAPPPPDPEVERRKKEELERIKAERAKNLKRGPGVAALVQGALKRALTAPTKKVPEPSEEEKKKAEAKAAAEKAQAEKKKAILIEEERENEEERRKQAEAKAKAEAARRKEQEAKEAAEREKAEREARARREQAKREAEEAEKALKKKEAETRDQRIKASVEAAKKQQAEREKLKAQKEAADNNLYANMPEVGDTVLTEADKKAAEEREKKAKLSNLPPADRSKVVFLDVDGVLRPARAGGFDVSDADTTTRGDTSDFFPSAVKALRHILERTGAIVVLSSEWRRSQAYTGPLTEFFEKNRMRPHENATTTKLELEKNSQDPLRSFATRRAHEISQWLNQHEGETSGWVVLDDINLAIADEAKKPATKQMSGHLVQTWPLCGLTMGNAKTAVRILNGEMINKVVVERPVAPVTGGGGGAAPAEGSGGAAAPGAKR